MTEQHRQAAHNASAVTQDPNSRHAGDGSTAIQLALGDDVDSWRSRSRIVLTPTAAPSIMGLTGFMLATVMVGAWQAGWYGSSNTGFVLWPFALVAGGLLQSIAAVASFRARDGLAVAIHTAWGAFWVGWGLLQLLVEVGVGSPIAFGASSPPLAFWFIGLTLVTFSCMIAALSQNAGLFATLAALTGGAGITAAGFWAGNLTTVRVGGWFFVVSAGLAWLVMTAMVLENSYGRTIIPLGAWSKDANVPGRAAMEPIQYRGGMPGAKVGQ
jgi:hypothetical protein